jgi:thioredoxin
MIVFTRFFLRSKLISPILLLAILSFLFLSCERADSLESKSATTKKALTVVKSVGQFNAILEASQNRLLIFEFYADWCTPCKALEPILEEIAKKYRDRVEIYKINYDESPKLAEWFKVYGLPYVAYVKNKIIVFSRLGLHPKETYISAIKSYSKN